MIDPVPPSMSPVAHSSLISSSSVQDEEITENRLAVVAEYVNDLELTAELVEDTG